MERFKMVGPEKKPVKEVDWEEYRRLFPDQYFRHSENDSTVETHVLDETVMGRVLKVLDVGGGVLGTRALRSEYTQVYSLDPNIEYAPAGTTKVGWGNLGTKEYDLVVARGSFNYLTELEIRALKASLVLGGMLLFNTFVLPKEVSRPFSNIAKNIYGVERTTINRELGLITHELETQEAAYRHTFNFHSLEHLVELVGTRGLSFHFSGSNSLTVKSQRLA